MPNLKKVGPTHQLYMLIKGLIKNDYDIHIVTFPKAFQDNELKDKFKKLGCHIYEYKRKWYTFLNNIILLKKRVKKINPNAVHSHLLFADVLSAITCFGFRRISTLRSIPTEELKMSHGFLKGFLLAKLHLWSLRFIDYPVACSKSVQLAYTKSKINAGMIYNAISLNSSQEKNTKMKRERIVKVHNISADSIVGLMVGSLCHRKNPIFAVNIMRELVKKHKNLFFLFWEMVLLSKLVGICVKITNKSYFWVFRPKSVSSTTFQIL